MKKAYQVFAFLIALEVLVQASAIAWAMYGLTEWIEAGSGYNEVNLPNMDPYTIRPEGDDCEVTDCDWNYTAERGFMIHGLNGFMIIPLISLIFLILSFFAKVPGGVKWALGLFVLVITQVVFLPELSRQLGAGFGALHGLNALVIFAVAIMAGKRVKTATVVETEPRRLPE